MIHSALKDTSNVIQMLDHDFQLTIKVEQDQKLEKYEKLNHHLHDIAMYEFCSWMPVSHVCFNPEMQQVLGLQKILKIKKFFINLIKTIQKLHHMDIYHLDLESSNILYENEDSFKIIGFGQAKHVEKTEVECMDALADRNQKRIHVRRYQNVFQIQQKGEKTKIVDADKYDAYQIGCLLYTLLTGKFLNDFSKLTYASYEFLYQNYGLLLADIIHNTTQPDEAIRYSVAQMLAHPFFDTQTRQISNRKQQAATNKQILEQFHFNYLGNLYMNMQRQYERATQQKRSQSRYYRKLYIIKNFAHVVNDDQNKIILQLSGYNSIKFKALDQQQLLRFQKQLKMFESTRFYSVILQQSFIIRESLMINVYMQFWQLRMLQVLNPSERQLITSKHTSAILQKPVILTNQYEKLLKFSKYLEKQQNQQLSLSDVSSNESVDVKSMSDDSLVFSMNFSENKFKKRENSTPKNNIDLKPIPMQMSALNIMRIESADLFYDEFANLLERQATYCTIDADDLGRYMSDQ